LPPRSEVAPVENPPPKLPPKPLTPRASKSTPRPLATASPLSAAFRHIRPNWRHYAQYVDLAARNGDQAMARYRDCYLALTHIDRLQHWPEQLCDLANVTPGELIGAVCRALWESKAAESSMVSAMAQPEVLATTAKLALEADHHRDRELFFRLTGSLPDKKGTSINIINNPMAQASVKLASEEPKLKSFDEDIIEMSRQLEGAPFLVKDEDVSPESD
jgi:hypothetical protein